MSHLLHAGCTAIILSFFCCPTAFHHVHLCPFSHPSNSGFTCSSPFLPVFLPLTVLVILLLSLTWSKYCLFLIWMEFKIMVRYLFVSRLLHWFCDRCTWFWSVYRVLCDLVLHLVHHVYCRINIFIPTTSCSTTTHQCVHESSPLNRLSYVCRQTKVLAADRETHFCLDNSDQVIECRSGYPQHDVLKLTLATSSCVYGL